MLSVWPVSSVLNAGLSSRLKCLLMSVLGRFLRLTDDSGKIFPDSYWRYPSLELLYLLMIMFTILEYSWKCPIPFSINHSSSSRRNKKKHTYSYPCKTRTCQFTTTLRMLPRKVCLYLQWCHEFSMMLSVLYTNNSKVQRKDKWWAWNVFFCLVQKWKYNKFPSLCYTLNNWKRHLHFYAC